MMGTRVNKFLGYGLTDIAARNEDDRINWDSWLFEYDLPPLDDYAAWLDGRHGESGHVSLDMIWLRHRDEKERRDLSDCIAWNPEYGDSSTLVLQPLGCPDWSRYDDPVDYVEETWLRPNGRSQECRVDAIPAGLFPFNGTYMDDRTGQRMPQGVIWWIRADNTQKRLAASVLDKFAKEAGFRDHAEAKAHCVPLVPQEIRDLAEFAGLFADDTVWLQLRPLLYTYWS